MEHKIISQEKNPFLKRDKITFEIMNEGVPSFEDIKNIVGKPEDTIVVTRVDSGFGSHTFTAEVLVYNSAEDKSKIEVIPQKIRKKMEAERKAAEEAKKAEEEAARKAEEEAKSAAEEAKKAEENSSEEVTEENKDGD